MKKIFISFICLLSLFALSFQTNILAASDQKVVINPYIRYQTMEGWGTNLSWWATQVGGWSATKKREVMNLVFGDNGLDLNLVRYNIPGGENPNCPYGQNHMGEGRKMEGFQSANGQWNWNADANQRWVLLDAKKTYKISRFEANSNSAPWWMTESQCAAGAQRNNNEWPIYRNNIKPNMYDNFANYITEVVSHYKKLGITFQTVDPLNEPSSGYWYGGNSQEGTYVDKKGQAQLIGDLRSKLDAKGLKKVGIVASDETAINQSIDTIQSFDENTKSKILRYNTHSYVDGDRYSLRDLAKSDEKKIWMTEFSTGNAAHSHTSMQPAIPLAKTIMKDIKESGSSAWFIWQPVENEIANLWNEKDLQSWGLIHGIYSDYTLRGVNYKKESYYMTKQYYVMKQFSKFVKSNFTIIETQDENVLAAQNFSTNELVLVVLNPLSNSKSYRLDLSKFTSVGSSAQKWVTSDSMSCKLVGSKKISNKVLIDSIPSNSIVTYSIKSTSFKTSANSFSKDKYYIITNSNSGMSLSVSDWSKANGATVIQWTTGINDNTKWKLTSTGDGYYGLINKNSGKALSVADWSKNNGANLVQWDWNTKSKNGKWKINKASDGYYYLTNMYSEKAIHIDGWSKANGAKALQWSFNGGNNGLFKIEAVN